METVYDWVSIAIFAGLVVLFMQRSTQQVQRDSLWQYLAAAVGCALANWLGNLAITEGRTLLHLAAIIVVAGTLGFVWVVLRPLDKPSE